MKRSTIVTLSVYGSLDFYVGHRTNGNYGEEDSLSVSETMTIFSNLIEEFRGKTLGTKIKVTFETLKDK